MRSQRLSRTGRSAARALLLAALLTTTLSHAALAADALIPHVDTGVDVPGLQQTVPTSPGPSTNQLVPTTLFVEDPTRQAGGEDDAQRASERQHQQQNDDDGDRRRK